MMFRKIITFIFILAITIAFFPVLAEAGSIHMRTYHASPAGQYKTLNLTPGPKPSPCPDHTIYMDALGIIRVCNPSDDDYKTATWTYDESEPYVFTTDLTADVGIGTATPEFRLDIESDGGIIARGSFGSGKTLSTSGSGARLIWYPRKAAFRVGTVGGTQWDDGNIGDYSITLGYNNEGSGAATTIAGGYNNTAQANYGAVGGGANNDAVDPYATIAGGNQHDITGWFSTVSGGSNNDITAAFYSTIGGGLDNSVTDGRATISGGELNTASGDGAVVGGGYNNTASGDHSTIGGGGLDSGSGNTASANNSTIAGGYGNTADGTSSFIGGGWSNQASGSGNVVGGGAGNIASGDMRATVAGGNSNDATARYSTVGGGSGNEARAIGATVSGGLGNISYTQRGYVGGGEDNIIGTAAGADTDAEHATIGGGRVNEVNSGDHATIAGGWDNLINHANDVVTLGATIAGGTTNTITEEGGSIIGGSSNSVSGLLATISGGSSNTASGDYSWAAGRGSTVSGNGSFNFGYEPSGGVLDLTYDQTFGMFIDGNGRFLFDNHAFTGTEDFHVTGDSRFVGDSTITGTATMGNASVSGTMTTNNATVGGNLTVMGVTMMRLVPVGGVAMNARNMGGGMYQVGLDYAEEFHSIEEILPGEIVVIDPDEDVMVRKSHKPHDTSAVGIASSHAAVVLKGDTVVWGVQDGGFTGGTEVPIALSGRVLCKVTNENGAIKRGDLLTTSSTPGHAMKVVDRTKATGAIIGKAMQSFDEETGSIAVLVTLQ